MARAGAATTAGVSIGVSMPRSSEVHDTAHRAPAQHAAPSMDAASSAYLVRVRVRVRVRVKVRVRVRVWVKGEGEGED